MGSPGQYSASPARLSNSSKSPPRIDELEDSTELLRDQKACVTYPVNMEETLMGYANENQSNDLVE